MRTALTLVLAIPCLALPLAAATSDDLAPRGRYVEARNATVFAGACHYGAEYTLNGRSAVLGFAFDGGVVDGVALAGLELVAVVSSDKNLKDAAATRRSVVYLPAAASAEQRAALTAWARSALAPVLGRVVAFESTAVEVAFDPKDRFALSAGERVALAGNGLPDRECCTMPFGRWYDPLVALEVSRVGFATQLTIEQRDLGVRVRRTEDNCAFFGRF